MVCSLRKWRVGILPSIYYNSRTGYISYLRGDIMLSVYVGDYDSVVGLKDFNALKGVAVVIFQKNGDHSEVVVDFGNELLRRGWYDRMNHYFGGITVERIRLG